MSDGLWIMACQNKPTQQAIQNMRTVNSNIHIGLSHRHHWHLLKHVWYEDPPNTNHSSRHPKMHKCLRYYGFEPHPGPVVGLGLYRTAY